MEKTGGNRCKLHQKRFYIDIGNIFFYSEDKFLRDMVASLLMKVFKTLMDRVLSNLTQDPFAMNG